jgi:hypothetical protein
MELEAISAIRQQTESQSAELKMLKKAQDQARQVVRLVENLPSAPNAPGIGINIDTEA